jgi:hypothetical protein
MNHLSTGAREQEEGKTSEKHPNYHHTVMLVYPLTEV